MPKYKNKENFVQPITQNGRRSAIRPGETFFSERELDLSVYPFLEKVDDSAKVSKPATISRPNVKSDEIKTLETQVKLLSDQVNQLTESTKNISQVEEQLSTVVKRMEVLKKAIDTLNTALTNVENEVFFNNNVVVTDDEDHKA